MSAASHESINALEEQGPDTDVEQTQQQVAAVTEQVSAAADHRIEVTDLDIYYGEFLAVSGVTMTIEPRSITALIGP